MTRNVGILMLCLVALAGCEKKEAPAPTGDQTSPPKAERAATAETAEGQPKAPAAEMAGEQPEAAAAEVAETPPAAALEADAPPVPTVATAAPVVPTKLGDTAYPLTGLSWVKGGPVTLTPGKVYVVEFWATWCPPCLTSIPHLTELQKKYADQGVVFVGVSNEKLPTVKPFVTRMGGKMDYNVAIDTNGAVVNGYMVAFGQNGIPTAFVVDANGKVVWYGHPAYPKDSLDEVIGEVVAGTYKVPG
jgi:thiol-disulfide isomerase/thioredoxin